VKLQPPHARVVVLFLTAVIIGSSARAERPMIVDDASTLEYRSAKIELGWARESTLSTFTGGFGYGFLDSVEADISFGRSRNGGIEPHESASLAGAEIKWIPLVGEGGLSTGLKYVYGRVDRTSGLDTHGMLALASWTFEAGPVASVNLGRSWSHVDADYRGSNFWGIGLDWPLADALHVTAEVFGTQHFGPDKALGIRFEIVEGLKLSGAIGMGNDRNFANAGLCWEF
jgi:hypothetical protein